MVRCRAIHPFLTMLCCRRVVGATRQANHDLHGVIEQKVDALLWKHTKEHAVTVDFGSLERQG